MKILFQVQVADSFMYPKDDGMTNSHLWPVPVGKSQELDIDIEFEPTSGDNLKDAEDALEGYMKKNYPNKDYKIYYWWWK